MPKHSGKKAAMAQVPLTVEGSWVLHQMFRLRWPEWRKLEAGHQQLIVDETASMLSKWEKHGGGQSALFSLLAKGDLMLVHFRHSFDELKHAELNLSRLGIFEYL